MNVLLVTLGSHGDLHPFLAIGRTLKARGHDAAVMTNAFFEPQVRAAGLTHLPLGDPAGVDIKDLLRSTDAMHPRKGPLVIVKELVLPLVPSIVEQVRARLRAHRPHAVIGHPIALGTSWACELEGVPYVAAVPAPAAWFNPNDTLVMTPWCRHRPSRAAVRFDTWAGRTLMRALTDRPLNAHRRAAGLRPARDAFFHEWSAGEANLGLWSPLFRGPLPGDPPTSIITGFPWYDRDHTVQADLRRLDAFLDAGDPPIVFTLGTTGVHVAGRFYAAAAEACRVLGKRGVLLIGRDEYARSHLPPRLPPGVEAFTYAPYSALFPRAAAVVHHGGIGSTAQGLRSGRPTVVCPLAHDQFDNAARVSRLGVSETVRHARATPARLAATLRAVIDTPFYAARAAHIAPAIAREDGAERAADVLEDLTGLPGAGRPAAPGPHAARHSAESDPPRLSSPSRSRNASIRGSRPR